MTIPGLIALIRAPRLPQGGVFLGGQRTEAMAGLGRDDNPRPAGRDHGAKCFKQHSRTVEIDTRNDLGRGHRRRHIRSVNKSDNKPYGAGSHNERLNRPARSDIYQGNTRPKPGIEEGFRRGFRRCFIDIGEKDRPVSPNAPRNGLAKRASKTS